MNIRKRVRQVGMLALGISLMAVLAFAWGQVNPDGAQAVAEGPAMSLGAPGTVFMGVTFQVTVTADPAPDDDIAGFGSEVIWFESDDSGVISPEAVLTPEGLKWQQRVPGESEASCLAEIQVGRADGGALAFCNSTSPILTGGASHALLSQFQMGAAALDVAPGSTTLLLELDFVCNTPGSYKLILTAVPDPTAPDGALYGSPAGAEIHVKTVTQDYDAGTHQVADTLTIECTDEPPPTDTPEPTDVPVPTDVSEPTATVEATVGGPVTGVGGSSGDSGSNAGLWVLIGALLVASVAGMTAFGWRYVRAR